MGTGRRLAVLLVALGLIGIPAAVLRIGCVGASCRSTAVAAAPAPFCSLPNEVRDLISAGTYEGRSPDALGVAGTTPVVSRVAHVEMPWPSEDRSTSAMTVPLEFIGRSILQGELPRGVTLDRVAPTLATALGIDRAHPDVRSGTTIPGVVRPGAPSPLAVIIAMKGIGRADLQRRLQPLVGDSGGSGSLGSANGALPTKNPVTQPAYLHGANDVLGTATTGSLPNDPVAVEATLGTGGMPSQHGITGTEIRNNVTGRVVEAFGQGSPQPVIATLGDDLDVATGSVSKIGLIATAAGDQALTGDAWYDTGPIVDRTSRAGARAVASFIGDGWGADRVPDLLAVALDGSATGDARATSAIIATVLRSVPDATFAIAGTGSLATRGAQTVSEPGGTDVVAAGGVFVDRGPGAVPAQNVVDSLKAETAPNGSPLFADAFASYAVRFGRYC
jgi:hypothetical protein